MKVYTNDLEKWKQEKNQQIIKITTVNKNIRASTQENLSSEVCEQRRRRQPAHTRSLISAFDIRLLESSISKLATGEI